MASRSNPLPPPVGRFRVDALLGSGGMVSDVVNRDEVGQAVSASIQLKHGRGPQ